MIAWLDTSREQQRRMREIIHLFAQTESRDELGIGQVRDSFSDRLFPGTSTLHTRARYLLFIPWCYRSASARHADGEILEQRAAANERRLIVALHDAGATDGLIGRNVLTKVKTLPSSLYWSALETWGIRIGDIRDELASRTWRPEPGDIVERAPAMWNVPEPPPGFPGSADTFALSYAEAVWARERMLSGSQGSLLEVLLTSDNDAWLEVEAAWDVQVDDPALKELVEHARLFSLVMQGAALSYNLALAYRYERLGFDRHESPVETHLASINTWADELEAQRDAVRSWDLESFWSGVTNHNPRVSPGTRGFVTAWIDLLRSGVGAQEQRARDLVADRETKQKRSQSRLTNEKLLRNWSGASGTARLTYRWANVTRLLTDINEGLLRAAA